MLKVLDNHIDDRIRSELVHSDEYESLKTPNVSTDKDGNVIQEGYYFWKMSEFNQPSNSIEKTLHAIWKDMIDPSEYAEGGIEYWAIKMNGESSGIWHLDLIEQEQQQGYEPGDKTIVYYPWVQCDGGFLELMINENSPSKGEMYNMLRAMDSNKLERIQPITNRAVFFNSNRIHRMSKMYSGTREMLASTVWKKIPLTFNRKA